MFMVPKVFEPMKFYCYSSVFFITDLGLAALCFICVILYFPAKPPKPPSKSESLEHTEYKKGVKKLTR